MSRNFWVGLLWGLVVCAAGLAVMSQLAPVGGSDPVAVLAEGQTGAEVPKAEPEATGAQAAPAATANGQVDLTAPAAQIAPEVPDAGAVPEATTALAPGASETGASGAQTDAAEPAAPTASAVQGEPAAPPQPAEPTEPAAPAPAMPAVAADPKPAEPQAQPGDLAADATAPDAVAGAPGVESAPAVPLAEPQAPAAPAADTAPLPDAGTMPAPGQDRLLDPPAAPQSPAVEPLPALPAVDPAQAAPEVVILPDPAIPEAPITADAEGPGLIELGKARLPPAPGLKNAAPGVTTNRLPRIGDPPQTETVAADRGPADTRPIAAYARAFNPEPDKPMFAILLQDIGAAGMARADLAKLPFAVTFVIDPSAPDAAQAMAAYRAAGQEVVIRAALPANATPGDLEQSFQALALGLPETVAILDAPEGGLQENRVLATQAIPILKTQGRGIVTYDRGLDAADQVARREGLASAVIFRDLDAQGEDTPLIRRYLDRAAFKAAQEGQVVVLGQTRPETVAAILEWMVEGRGATVSLAPLTAVMRGGS